MSNPYSVHKNGFTLIELLIVIVIIGLLTSVAAASYVKAQANARDDARKADLHALSTAVETYYAANKKFPGKEVKPSNAPMNNTAGGCEFYDNKATTVYFYVPEADCSNKNIKSVTYNPALYSNDTTWIPGMTQYLSPFPAERRYVMPPSLNDMLLNAAVRTYAYRHLDGGYMVYGRLEGTTANGDDNFFASTPNFTGEPLVPVTSVANNKNLYIIRN